MAMTDRASVAERWLREGEPTASSTVAELWQWLAGRTKADVEPMLLGSLGTSPKRSGGLLTRHDQETVTEWLPLIVGLLDHQPRAASSGRHAAARQGEHEPPITGERRGMAGCRAGQAAATLVLAVLRGLLLDLSATGDRPRAQHAFDLFDTVIGPIVESCDPGPQP